MALLLSNVFSFTWQKKTIEEIERSRKEKKQRSYMCSRPPDSTSNLPKWNKYEHVQGIGMVSVTRWGKQRCKESLNTFLKNAMS